MIYIICGIIVVLFFMIFFIFFKISKLKDIKKSLEICDNNINVFLDKKLSLVNELLLAIKDKKIKKQFSYSEDFSLYERENALYNISFNINKYIKDNKMTEYKKKIKELSILEENLDGLKDYYNSYVSNYNNIFLKGYLNKLFRLFGFNDYKSFKTRKLEEYEIFKN